MIICTNSLFRINLLFMYWNDSNVPASLPALNAEALTIHEFIYQAGETPKSSEVNALGDYDFGAHPVLIELRD
ncbi:MAG: hypothetical protein AAF620_16135 [Bacteroidota bacterium]